VLSGAAGPVAVGRPALPAGDHAFHLALELVLVDPAIGVLLFEAVDRLVDRTGRGRRSGPVEPVALRQQPPFPPATAAFASVSIATVSTLPTIISSAIPMRVASGAPVSSPQTISSPRRITNPTPVPTSPANAALPGRPAADRSVSR